MNPVFQSPDYRVPPSDKIEVVIQGNRVIQTDIVVSQDAAVDQDGGKGDDPAILTPDKKPCAIRHPPSEFVKVNLREFFKPQLRSSQGLQIKRINFFNERGNICNYLPFDRQSTF